MTAPIIFVIEEAGQGGTEVYVEGLARFLSQSREVEIVTLSGDAATAEARFPEVKTRALSGVGDLAHYLRSRPDAVVNLHLYTSLLSAAYAARRSVASLLVTLHQPLAPWNAWHRMRWRIAVILATHVIGVSYACLSGFGMLLRPERSSVISGPLSIGSLGAPVNPKPDVSSPRILFVGRLSREKDLPTLIRAVATIDASTLEVIGDGPEREVCVTLTRELNVDARFHGTLSREKVFNVMKQADIFVLSSRFEGFGIAAIEAMALGVPTIVANFPAATEYVISERTGLTFPIGDHSALAACLTRLIKDPKLRDKLSHEGSTYVRHAYSETVQYGKYERVIDKVTSVADQIA